MASRAKRRKVEEKARPSVFFIVALLIGLALLVWAFIELAGKPPRPTTFGRYSNAVASAPC